MKYITIILLMLFSLGCTDGGIVQSETEVPVVDEPEVVIPEVSTTEYVNLSIDVLVVFTQKGYHDSVSLVGLTFSSTFNNQLDIAGLTQTTICEGLKCTETNRTLTIVGEYVLNEEFPNNYKLGDLGRDFKFASLRENVFPYLKEMNDEMRSVNADVVVLITGYGEVNSMLIVEGISVIAGGYANGDHIWIPATNTTNSTWLHELGHTLNAKHVDDIEFIMSRWTQKITTYSPETIEIIRDNFERVSNRR